MPAPELLHKQVMPAKHLYLDQLVEAWYRIETASHPLSLMLAQPFHTVLVVAVALTPLHWQSLGWKSFAAIDKICIDARFPDNLSIGGDDDISFKAGTSLLSPNELRCI